MNTEQLITNIKDLCKVRGIKISQLESDLGFGTGLISRWTKSAPSLLRVIDIADYFKISLDELVGRNAGISDDFLLNLCKITSEGKIRWNTYDHDGDESNLPLKYDDSEEIRNIDIMDSEDYEYFCKTYRTLYYYTNLNGAYISIYTGYYKPNIKEPVSIKLFIQPKNASELVMQDYKKDDLLPLWIKILLMLSDSSPAEIRADEIKTAIANGFMYNLSFDCSEIENKLLKMEYLVLHDRFTNEEIKEVSKGYTSPSVDFYRKNRTELGSVTNIKKIGFDKLLLQSETKIMKLDGVTSGRESGAGGLGGTRTIIKEAGFNISDDFLWKNEEFELYK